MKQKRFNETQSNLESTVIKEKNPKCGLNGETEGSNGRVFDKIRFVLWGEEKRKVFPRLIEVCGKWEKGIVQDNYSIDTELLWNEDPIYFLKKQRICFLLVTEIVCSRDLHLFVVKNDL